MDINKEFEKFLPEWCEKNKKPLPKKDSFNKIWKAAWEDFMRTRLKETWEERRQEFLNMKLLTKREMQERKKETPTEEVESNESDNTTPKQPTSWEIVQKYLN